MTNYNVRHNNDFDLFNLETLFGDLGGSKHMMRTDIFEKEDKVFLEIEIPGISKENIKISLDKGYLTVSATKEEVKDRKFYRQERSVGTYSRTFFLDDVKQDDISASFNDGILTISFLKERAKEESKLIQIN